MLTSFTTRLLLLLLAALCRNWSGEARQVTGCWFAKIRGSEPSLARGSVPGVCVLVGMVSRVHELQLGWISLRSLSRGCKFAFVDHAMSDVNRIGAVGINYSKSPRLLLFVGALLGRRVRESSISPTPQRWFPAEPR